MPVLVKCEDELHQEHAAGKLAVSIFREENILHPVRDRCQLRTELRMFLSLNYVEIPIEMHDPLKIEQGIHERIAELDD